MEEEVRTFFRHCPACGHRFEVRLVGKELEDENIREEKSTPPTLSIGGFAAGQGIYAIGHPAGFKVLEESTRPTAIDARDFDYTYKCGHCSHIWHELGPVDSEVSLPEGGEDELVGESTDGPTEEEAEEDQAADQD